MHPLQTVGVKVEILSFWRVNVNYEKLNLKKKISGKTFSYPRDFQRAFHVTFTELSTWLSKSYPHDF